MLAYISVVKQKVKEGKSEEYVAIVKTFNIADIKGARRREVIEVDEHNFIIIMEEELQASTVTATVSHVSA